MFDIYSSEISCIAPLIQLSLQQALSLKISCSSLKAAFDFGMSLCVLVFVI